MNRTLIFVWMFCVFFVANGQFWDEDDDTDNIHGVEMPAIAEDYRYNGMNKRYLPDDYGVRRRYKPYDDVDSGFYMGPIENRPRYRSYYIN
ncbi:hypothetical protein M3Y95_01142700 [Aphelenchoides besseyi]|nr:hypothetical protein M3Y95_01142700 [Aphelenchoides besseyi]